MTATGRNTAASPTSLINVPTTVGLIFLIAFLPSNPAPIHISAIGVAVCDIFAIVLSIIAGKSILRSEATSPARIPIIIGLVIMLYKAFLMLSFLIFLAFLLSF